MRFSHYEQNDNIYSDNQLRVCASWCSVRFVQLSALSRAPTISKKWLCKFLLFNIIYFVAGRLLAFMFERMQALSAHAAETSIAFDPILEQCGEPRPRIRPIIFHTNCFAFLASPFSFRLPFYFRPSTGIELRHVNNDSLFDVETCHRKRRPTITATAAAHTERHSLFCLRTQSGVTYSVDRDTQTARLFSL